MYIPKSNALRLVDFPYITLNKTDESLWQGHLIFVEVHEMMLILNSKAVGLVIFDKKILLPWQTEFSMELNSLNNFG